MTKTHRKKVGVRYHCDACRKDVSEISRIQCAECEDFDLCVECFADGVQVSSHQNDHPYRVVDTLMFPIFEETWGAEEELLLMEGLEKYGMGNWWDVSDHIGTKSAIEVEEHYYNVFVNSTLWPVPEMTQQFEINSPIRRSVPKTDAIRKNKPLASQPCNHEVAGFMPGRQEFETDYAAENDEICVKNMYFDSKDSVDESEFKYILGEIYYNKIERKYERKKFILERELYEYKKVSRTNSRWRQKTEKDQEKSVKCLI